MLLGYNSNIPQGDILCGCNFKMEEIKMKEKVNVLVVGGGGRESAIAWKLHKSERVGKLFIAPGNGGTALVAENVPIEATDIDALARFAIENKVDLIISGTEVALAFGIVSNQELKNHQIKVFGPSKDLVWLETSKAKAKGFMASKGIPTPEFRIFKNYDKALEFIKRHSLPIVIKPNGLTGGKGVKVCWTIDQAREALEQLMIKRVYQDAGKTVVIEEYVPGNQEISAHVFCDGKTGKIAPVVQDHKNIYEGDEGPNTGGMGAYGPVTWVNAEMLNEIRKRVVNPTMENLQELYVGILFPGLKFIPDTSLKTLKFNVLEFNIRPGDPETQVLMMLLKSDLIDVVEACIEGKLDDFEIVWNDEFAVCVVLASDGYPLKYSTDFPISGLEEAEKISGVEIFHSGTVLRDGVFYTSGGRVLSVTAKAKTLEEAIKKAYEAVDLIHFKNKYCRRDIGAKA